jgi:carbamoyl-phosphate synthase large subunit
VSVARALRAGWRGDLELTALGYDPFMGGAWAPGLIDRFHLLAENRNNDETLIDRILEIHAERNFDALLPCDHAEVPAVAMAVERLAAAGIRTLVARQDRLAAVARPRMAAFLQELDLHTPHTLFVPARRDIPTCAAQLGFPLWVKGPVDGAMKVHSVEQAQDAAEKLEGSASGGVLLQRPVDGEIFDVAAVLGKNGRLAGLVATRRLAINDDGQVVCAAVVDDPQIETLARRLLDALEWRGALRLVLARPAAGDRLYVCDVRAGLPVWGMLSHCSDCSLPVRLLDAVLETDEHGGGKARTGKIYVRGIEEATIPLKNFLQLDRRRHSDGIERAKVSVRAPGDDDRPQSGLRVAVTGTSTFDVINPGIGVARSLRLAPEVSRIYGLSYGTFDSGIYDPGLFDASFQMPVGGSSSTILRRLLEIHEEHPFDVVIPCLDGELPQFIDIREELASAGVRTLLPEREAFDRRAKVKLFNGSVPDSWGSFELPESVIAGSEAKVLDAARKIGFPVAIKGPLAQCVRAENPGEAKAAWRRLTAFGITKVIVQPFIAGQFFAVATVTDRRHRALASMTVKKLTTCARGSTWSAIRVTNRALEADVARLLADIGWVGPAEAEFIRDELRDRYYLIEINPRFTAWIYFSACSGANHPRIATLAAAGESVETKESDDQELVFVRTSHELPVKATSLAAISTKGYVHNGHM